MKSPLISTKKLKSKDQGLGARYAGRNPPVSIPTRPNISPGKSTPAALPGEQQLLLHLADTLAD